MVQPQQDQSLRCQRSYLPKRVDVQVLGYHDPTLCPSPGEHAGIGLASEVRFVDADCVLVLSPQRGRDLRREVLIGKELHLSPPQLSVVQTRADSRLGPELPQRPPVLA